MEPVTVRAAPWNWSCIEEWQLLEAVLFDYSVAIQRVKINEMLLYCGQCRKLK
jgi:hypothetical protein